MKYTLELKVMQRESRLQEGNNWRDIKDSFALELGDKIYEQYPQLYREKIRLEVSSDLKTTMTIKETMQKPYFFARVHREIKTRIPSKEELKETIARGNDDQHNSLIINIDGYFMLADMETMEKIKTQKIPSAARYETFAAGNDYVGENAAADNSLINRIYRTMMQAYYQHLTSGRLDRYTDIDTGETEKDIIAKIMAHNLKI